MWSEARRDASLSQTFDIRWRLLSQSVDTTAARMATIAPARLASLIQLRCRIFQTSYNPTSVRTGAKYLRRRLIGPSLLKYYPEELDVAAAIRQFKELKVLNEEEEQRLMDVADRKARGKGAPKKVSKKGMYMHSGIRGR